MSANSIYSRMLRKESSGKSYLKISGRTPFGSLGFVVFLQTFQDQAINGKVVQELLGKKSSFEVT